MPIVNSVSFSYDDADTWYDVAIGNRPGHIYNRSTNPTVSVFEEKMRLLEQAEAATSFATGMAAISSTLFALLQSGDRVVSVKDKYGGTSVVFLNHLPRFGIDVALCDTTDPARIEGEVPNGCDNLYLETPTNPTMNLLDIEQQTALGK